jgi:hypothetical protein
MSRAPLIVLVGIVIFLAGVATAQSPATQPISAAQQARLDRGEKLREMLLGTLEQSYHDGVWPDHLPVDELIYTKPSKFSDAWQDIARSMGTVVMHEPLETHADGVWVGCADGHLEFAADSAALNECENQLPLIEKNIAIVQWNQASAAEPSIGEGGFAEAAGFRFRWPAARRGNDRHLRHLWRLHEGLSAGLL